jgi:hypothetical protein
MMAVRASVSQRTSHDCLFMKWAMQWISSAAGTFVFAAPQNTLPRLSTCWRPAQLIALMHVPSRFSPSPVAGPCGPPAAGSSGWKFTEWKPSIDRLKRGSFTTVCVGSLRCVGPSYLCRPMARVAASYSHRAVPHSLALPSLGQADSA